MSVKTKKRLAAVCPNCEETIYFNELPEVGQLITCFECDDELEIIEINPILLSWPIYDEEEWEYADFDDDDDVDVDDDDF